MSYSRQPGRVDIAVALVSALSGLATLVLVVLKLAGVIGWSWLWVLSPALAMWGGSLFFGLSLVVLVTILRLRR